MKTVVDLLKAMPDYPDIGVSLQVQDAIRRALEQHAIDLNDQLSGHVLGEIRQCIYDQNREPDPFDLLFQGLAGKTSNPIEAALQYIEGLAREQMVA